MVRLRKDEWASIRGVTPLAGTIQPATHELAAQMWLERFHELAHEMAYGQPARAHS